MCVAAEGGGRSGRVLAEGGGRSGRVRGSGRGGQSFQGGSSRPVPAHRPQSRPVIQPVSAPKLKYPIDTAKIICYSVLVLVIHTVHTIHFITYHTPNAADKNNRTVPFPIYASGMPYHTYAA